MGQENTVPRRINGVEGAAGQVMLSGGPGAIETWGAPAPAAHVHAAGDVTSGQFPLARMPRVAAGNFLEGNGVAADPIFNALVEGNIPDHMAKGKLAFTLNKLLKGAGAGADPTEIDPGATLTVVETEVFNGNSPAAAAWTDLNLSGTVGSQATLVLLKILPTAQKAVAFRKDGDTDEFWINALIRGCAAGDLYAGKHQVFLVTTSDTGIIEWKYEGLTEAVTIDIIAYIK